MPSCPLRIEIECPSQRHRDKRVPRNGALRSTERPSSQGAWSLVHARPMSAHRRDDSGFGRHSCPSGRSIVVPFLHRSGRVETSFSQAFPRPSKFFLLASASLGAVAVLAWSLWVLLFWGLLSLLFVGFYATLLFRRRERSTAAEWLGILGITLSAGVAWSAGTGRLEPEAFFRVTWARDALLYGVAALGHRAE